MELAHTSIFFLPDLFLISKVICEFLSLSCQTFADGFSKVPASLRVGFPWRSLTPVTWPKAGDLCPAAGHVAHVCYMRTRGPASSIASTPASGMAQGRLQTNGNKARLEILPQM